MMKAVLLDKASSHNDLRIGEAAIPEPDADSIRVQVHAVGLNPVDWKLAAWGCPDWTFPHILGLDVAGVVDKVGSNVTKFKVGDRVFYHGDLGKQGGYAEYACSVAHTAALIPDDISFVHAASIPCAGLTAYQALTRKLHVKCGQKILIAGAAGGVGAFCVQLARHFGLEVIGTCSAHNFDFVRKLGANHVIDYNTEDVVRRVSEITHGEGVENVVDTVSTESATTLLQCLSFFGGIACIAGTAKLQPNTWKALSVHDISLGGCYRHNSKAMQDDLGAMTEEFAELVKQRAVDLEVMINSVISLEEISHGLEQIFQRHVAGKIVAKIV